MGNLPNLFSLILAYEVKIYPFYQYSWDDLLKIYKYLIKSIVSKKYRVRKKLGLSKNDDSIKWFSNI